MAKGKSKAAAAADEAVEQARAKAAEQEQQEETSAEDKPKGAPRKRKYDYGIQDDAQIEVMLPEEQIPQLRGDLTGALTAIGQGCTVLEYKGRGGDRASLRRLSRRGIINLVHPDGTRFPRDYVKPEPAPAPAESDEGGDSA